MTEPQIIYTKFSQFDIACYDIKANKIFVDEKLKGYNEVKGIIEHELAHSRSKKTVDWSLELIPNRVGQGFAILAKKPLWLFSPFVPVIAYKEDNEWTMGIEWFRVALIVSMISLIAVYAYLL